MRSINELGENAKVLYISDLAHTKGHIYRVLHSIEALQSKGVRAEWISSSEGTSEKIGKADIVIVFRGLWNDFLSRLYSHCQKQSIPIGFDIDDLIFDPHVLTEENCDFLRVANKAVRKDWLENRVFNYRQTLLESDFAIVSTSTLALAIERLGKPAFVLPNGFDERMIKGAKEAFIEFSNKPSRKDGWLRLGYASGTPTHQKDFGTISSILSDLMDDWPRLMLTVVGYLDLKEFPELNRHKDRIELRDLVPHSNLLQEYARFDINLAPLEIGNPFCEAKSALKFVEAALVKVPTVAAATSTFQEIISDGETGWTAQSTEDWHTRINSLIEDITERELMGHNAQRYVLSTLGTEAKFAILENVYQVVSQTRKS